MGQFYSPIKILWYTQSQTTDDIVCGKSDHAIKNCPENGGLRPSTPSMFLRIFGSQGARPRGEFCLITLKAMRRTAIGWLPCAVQLLSLVVQVFPVRPARLSILGSEKHQNTELGARGVPYEPNAAHQDHGVNQLDSRCFSTSIFLHIIYIYVYVCIYIYIYIHMYSTIWI